MQLTGVLNAQYKTVQLTGVIDNNAQAVNASGTMGVLIGDVNASGVVTSGDTNIANIGNGGNVNVRADSLLINGMGSLSPTGIFASTGSSFEFNVGNGNAGNVMVRAGNVIITAGGSISASTFSLGNAGSVDIIADSLLIDGTGSDLFSGIVSESFGTFGIAGSITVQVARDLKQPLSVGILDHRHHQATGGIGCEADVVVVLEHKLLAV